MILIIQRRAEIAIRSLQTIERKQIERSLHELRNTDHSMLRNNHKLHKLNSEQTDKQLFVYKGTPKLRLILSFPDEDTCLIQDIVDHDHLNRLFGLKVQE